MLLQRILGSGDARDFFPNSRGTRRQGQPTRPLHQQPQRTTPTPPRLTRFSVPLLLKSLWRIENGQLAEGWEVHADLPFLQALGVVAYTEFGKPLEEVFR
ncbi:MAG: hypothetical protein GY788_05750 [bacterium]|nr:hypothetical protein [bacterium]